MAENRIVSYKHADALTLAEDMARSIALTGNAPADAHQEDYLKELGQMAVVPLLVVLINEIRALRADEAQREHDRRMRAATPR